MRQPSMQSGSAREQRKAAGSSAGEQGRAGEQGGIRGRATEKGSRAAGQGSRAGQQARGEHLSKNMLTFHEFMNIGKNQFANGCRGAIIWQEICQLSH